VAENDDELTLTVGDTISVLQTSLEDAGWWKGELNGKIGVFPDNFVELLPAVSCNDKVRELLMLANQCVTSDRRRKNNSLNEKMQIRLLILLLLLLLLSYCNDRIGIDKIAYFAC
jgi:hypothetical protein